MIACGGWNIDDIRKKAGDAPLNTEWSKRHFITKNYSNIEDIENNALITSEKNKGGIDKDE